MNLLRYLLRIIQLETISTDEVTAGSFYYATFNFRKTASFTLVESLHAYKNENHVSVPLSCLVKVGVASQCVTLVPIIQDHL